LTDSKAVSQARKLRRTSTEAERRLWALLSSAQLNGVKFRRQHPIGTYIVDFVSLDSKLIIEIDGGHHNMDDVRQGDESRTAWLTGEGYSVLRFWNNDVINNPEGVIEGIREAL
jgi:very-short-patch-repair endonuclease